MKKHIANYQRVFSDRGQNIESLFETVSKSNLDAAVEVLSEIVETYDDCVFDITGGEEILTLALGIVYSKYSDKKIQIHRFNLRNNTVYDCDKDGTTIYKETPTLSIEENIRIYKSAVDQFIFESGEPSDTDKAGYHRQCAMFKKALGEIQDAIVNLEAAYSIYLKYFSDRNPRSLDVLVELIECYVVAKNYDMVKQLVEQAYMVAEKVYTVGHPTLQKLNVMKSEYSKIT